MSPTLAQKLTDFERRKAHVDAELQSSDVSNVIEFHPDLAAKYQHQIERLHHALNSDHANARLAAMEILRAMIKRIEIYPGEKRGAFSIGLDGQISAIMQIAHLGGQMGDLQSMVTMVAGAGSYLKLMLQFAI